MAGAIPDLGDYANDVYFRPHVLFNKATRKFVMWVNRNVQTNGKGELPDHISKYSSMLQGHRKAGYLVATADSPEGPFKVVHVLDAKDAYWSGGGDFTLYHDDHDDGEAADAYIAYASWSNGLCLPGNPNNIPAKDCHWIDNDVMADGLNGLFTATRLTGIWPLNYNHLTGSILSDTGHRIAMQKLSPDFLNFEKANKSITGELLQCDINF